MQDSLNILFIKVPEVDFEEKKISYAESLALDAPPMPLGIASLSGYLKKMTRHSIHLLDMFAEGFESYSSRHDRNVLIDLTERRIRELMPDVIGISALMIINYKWVHHIAGLAKKIKPEVKVIVGGGYAAILPEKVLEDGNVDFIVIGEGEEVILNILDSGFDRQKLASSAGVGFRDESGRNVINRKPASIKDLDALPFYDWEGMGLEKYMRYHKKKFLSYITSRGCPFGCSFCSTHLLWGKKFRPFSCKRVLDEIDYLKRTYGIEEIEFRDDNLTLDRERIVAILSGFIERGYGFTWTTPNAVAIVTLDATLIGLMKKSGCEMLTIAIESGSERVLKEIIHKPVSKDKAREVRRIAREAGLKIQTAFIIGFPGETKEEIEETKNFAVELQCDWNQISIATPFPGTEMYEICEKNNFFVKADSDLERYRYGFANIRTGEFDEKWLKEKAYAINIEVNFIRNHNFDDDPRFAIEQFADILSRYPKHLIGIICLAYAYHKAGEPDLARETIEQAVELAERDPEIYETYGKYIVAGNPLFGDFLALRKVRDAEASEARSQEAISFRGGDILCPYCGSKNTFVYYEARMPNILSACPHSMLESVKMFPFGARLCLDCFLGFNASRLDQEQLRLIYDNYLYISPMSGIGQTKYGGMVRTLCKYFDKQAELVEIGCSEGYLLHMMSSKGYKRLTGIEPGPQAEQARGLGLNIIRDYFDGNTFKGRTVDGFFLMHVFEHFDDPFSMLEHMKEQLAPDGKIVIEVPDFGGYHHQHLFFFSLPFFVTLCSAKGLKIIEKKRERGALRVVIVHDDAAGYQAISPLKRPEAVVAAARKQYRHFNESVTAMRRLLDAKRGGPVYWWGAGSSAVVYLNQVDTSVLEDTSLTVVDGDKNKWGMFIPGPDLEVHPFTILENKSIKTLIIASEFHAEILETCKRHNITAEQVMVVQ